MSRRAKTTKSYLLDAETRAALEEGLRLAKEDPRRWTPEEVRADAKKLAKEWQEKLNSRKSS